MRKQNFIILVVIGVLLGPGIIFAEWEKVEKPQASEEALRNMARDDQNRRVEQLSRSITSLERKMDRLEDRLERLDEDFKEFKRSQSSKKSEIF